MLGNDDSLFLVVVEFVRRGLGVLPAGLSVVMLVLLAMLVSDAVDLETTGMVELCGSGLGVEIKVAELTTGGKIVSLSVAVI